MVNGSYLVKINIFSYFFPCPSGVFRSTTHLELVDIHHQDKPGITFMHLDGRTTYLQPGLPAEQGRWREPTDSDPTFYQVPLRSLVPEGYGNLILAGRMLDADKTAFSAVRVMVNTNQMGEAAGVAACVALSAGVPVQDVDPDAVRGELARGGSIVI